MGNLCARAKVLCSEVVKDRSVILSHDSGLYYLHISVSAEDWPGLGTKERIGD